jgi:hypothetical protein
MSSGRAASFCCQPSTDQRVVQAVAGCKRSALAGRRPAGSAQRLASQYSVALAGWWRRGRKVHADLISWRSKELTTQRLADASARRVQIYALLRSGRCVDVPGWILL